MFYAIRECLDVDGIHSGSYYVMFGADAEAFADRASTKDYASVDAARADFPLYLVWTDPDADSSPDVILVAEDA